MLSFEQLGSPDIWPVSHSNPAVKDTLQQLSAENIYLRHQLATRADTKFVKGILQKSVSNVHLVNCGSANTDLEQHCLKLDSERLDLKHEVYQLKLLLNSTNPGALTVLFLQDQLAAETRLREFHTLQHTDVHDKLDKASAGLNALCGDVNKLTIQNDFLLKTIENKLSAPQQVSRLAAQSAFTSI